MAYDEEEADQGNDQDYSAHVVELACDDWLLNLNHIIINLLPHTHLRIIVHLHHHAVKSILHIVVIDHFGV